MAKKKQKTTNDPIQLDMSKGFSTGAFSSLKALQDIRKSEEEEEKAAAARREAEARARLEAQKAQLRDFRFTEEDLNDTSDMTDAEIFEASMRGMDKGVDIYQSKFNVKEKPRPKMTDAQTDHLTMSDSEREFALFTQEMAISSVQRLAPPPKPKQKVRNKGKYTQQAKALETLNPVSVVPAPVSQEPGMKTEFIEPSVTVTQVEKGDNIIERPDMDDAMTASQKQLLRDVRRYESRYGIVITLKLRGMTLNAAMSRLDEFITSCIHEKKAYALVVCGKGLGSAGEPVIKNRTVEYLRSDKRVIEYAPVLNNDGDFGSIYLSFRKL